MKKIILYSFLSLALFAAKPLGKKASLSSSSLKFKGTTQITDVEAESKSVKGVLEIDTKKFTFKVDMLSFAFENSMMRDHFNEKYVESEKFPTAEFSGKILNEVNLAQDGTHEVSAKGKLTVHGETQNRTISVKLDIKGGKITADSEFYVKMADHKITVPSMAVAKLGEAVKLNGHFVMDVK